MPLFLQQAYYAKDETKFFVDRTSHFNSKKEAETNLSRFAERTPNIGFKVFRIIQKLLRC